MVLATGNLCSHGFSRMDAGQWNVLVRAIEFRAWDKESNRMIVGTQDFIPLVVTNAGVFRLSAMHEMNLYSLCEPARFEITQFTGLLDSKGTKIFESDIVRCHRRANQEVSFTEDGGYWPFEYYGGGESIPSDCTVIGNIFEQPELLEGKG